MKVKRKRRPNGQALKLLPVAFKVPESVHKAAKYEASIRGLTMSLVLRGWIENYLQGGEYSG